MTMYTPNLTLTLMTLLCLPRGSEGRGRLVDPPARGSMWRYGFKTPRNYNDNGLNCGGVAVQWGMVGGKCGVCGDPYSSQREHEAGGKYATGTISRKYKQGQVITAVVEVSANERGWFQFNLCAHDNPATPVTEECLNQTVLELPAGGTRYDVPSQIDGLLSVDLRLPADVTCSQCVFRWKWNAGNMWGWSASGEACLGCGHQEQFYGCSDVTIMGRESGDTAPTTTPTTTSTTTATPATTSTTERTTTPTTTQAATSTTLHSLSSPHCYAVNLWQGESTLDFWCRLNCLTYNYCPEVYCKCDK